MNELVVSAGVFAPASQRRDWAARTPNKVLQPTQTALGHFSLFLSHNGLLPCHGSLPVTRARFGLLNTGVRNAPPQGLNGRDHSFGRIPS
jgi:hypothetical protein